MKNDIEKLKDMIKAMVVELTDAPTTIEIDNDPTSTVLGATYNFPTGFVIEFNVDLHVTLYGSGALEQLWDTIRHEVAHVEHIRSLNAIIYKLANEYLKSDWESAMKWGTSPQPFERLLQWAENNTMKGHHSAHGPEWKKYAKQLGATPKASGKKPNS